MAKHVSGGFILVKSVDGGTGTFVLSLLKLNKAFTKKALGLEVLVLETPSFRVIRTKKINFFRNKDFYPHKYFLSLSNIVDFIKEILWVKKHVDEIKPTIILSVDLRCNLIAIIIKFFSSNIKVITTTHINLKRVLLDKSSLAVKIFLSFAIHFLYDQADFIVTVSKRLSLNLKRDFKIKKDLVTIYNGVKVDESLKEKSANIRKKNKVIVSIARLDEQKDHKTLIKAFCYLNYELPSSQLWILSDGPMRKELEKFAKNIGISKKVKFYGWVKSIKPYLKRADIFVLSSKREGFAYVLVEAMSCGLPIISTNTFYGPSEVLDNGRYGILTSVGDAIEMKDAIFQLLTDSKKYDYYSSKALERSKFFSEEKMLQKYKKLILKLK